MDTHLSGIPFKREEGNSHHPGITESSYDTYKRVSDLVIALLLLALGWPLLLLIGILIKVDSPGPVIFRQVRIGRGGKPFSMLKFRTMIQGGDELLAGHLDRDPALKLSYKQYQKLKDDPRLTWAGLILRRSSLDELPQLWNVINGEMSLVRVNIGRHKKPSPSRLYTGIAAKPRGPLPRNSCNNKVSA